MNLPEHTGFIEFSAADLGQHFGSYIEDALTERDKLIEDLRFEIVRLKQELDEADQRIEQLSSAAASEVGV